MRRRTGTRTGRWPTFRPIARPLKRSWPKAAGSTRRRFPWTRRPRRRGGACSTSGFVARKTPPLPSSGSTWSLTVPFSQFGLHSELLRGLKDLGFQRPTPIQSDAIPPALAGKDLLACAMTGSGKTVAFLLPILHKLIAKPRGTTRALILTPTRELAAQILSDLEAVATHTPISAASVFGGVGMGPQEHAFKSGVDVIVG